MAYGLPASAWLENGLPSAPTSVKGPPKLALTGPAVATGRERSCATPHKATMPISASAISAHANSRTCFSLDFGGAFSVTSDHHPQIGAAFGCVECAYRPSMRQRNLPGEAE